MGQQAGKAPENGSDDRWASMTVSESKMGHPLTQDNPFKYLQISDSDRIQTYNLLIRSQVLYSVELRSHCMHVFATPTAPKGTAKVYRFFLSGKSLPGMPGKHCPHTPSVSI